MKKIIISFAILAATVFTAAAQNLDPTVEVSRKYEGKLMDVHKPDMEMAVPDSVHRFDLDFDYSVFDNPYKGSYEFNPYTMDMKPESRKTSPAQFYMNVGAGYTLHPTLDVLWSPVLTGPFKVDVYGSNRSYIGDYRASHVGDPPAGTYFKGGYDVLSNAGADLGYDFEKVSLGFGASYHGVAVKDAFKKDAYNAVNAYMSIRSKGMNKFIYGAKATYRYGHINGTDEHLLGVAGNVSHLFRPYNRVVVDLGLDYGKYQGQLDASYANFWLTPRYVREKGRARTSVGVRVSAVASRAQGFAKANQFVYPDIRASYDVIKDAMRVYLNVTGGESVNTYASMIDRNHHFSLAYSVQDAALLGSSVERVRPEVGLDGRISSFFTYALKAGYVLKDHALMDVLVKDDAGYLPAFGYGGYSQAYAGAECTLNLEAFRFDGAFRYAHTWGLEALEGAYFVKPADFNAEVSAEYNWLRRVYVGVDCEFASNARTDDKAVFLPYYVDLGAYAEYAVGKKVSLWLRGGNLLNMEIQRNPLFAEKGINFTAGICLIF